MHRDRHVHAIATLLRHWSSKVLLWVMVSTGALGSAWAGTWVLDPTTVGRPLGLELRFLEDPGGQLTLAQVMARDQDFGPSTNAAPNFGFTESAYWFAVRLENRSSDQTRWVLEQQYPHLDHLSFYFLRDGVLIDSSENGRLLPFAHRALKHRNMMQPLLLKQGEHVDLYVRVQTASSLQLPLVTWSQPALAAKDHEEQYALGLYYGVLLAMLIFNLMIFLSIRVVSYLHYLHYIGGYIVFQMTLNGLAYEYLWPQWPRWNEMALPFFIAFALQGMINFTRSFLDVKTNLPRLEVVMRVQSWFLVALMLATPFANYGWVVKLATANALIATTLVLSAGIACLAKGIQAARYFILAWVTLLAGIALYVLKTFNVLPTNFITEYGLQVGSALEAVLLSFALAHRMKLLTEENRRIQNEAKSELEQNVQQRTLDLDLALKKLSEANEVLQRLNVLDGLTGAKNRKYFDEQLAAEVKRANRAGLPMALLLVDIDHFKLVNDSHGHLAGDECLRALTEAMRGCLKRPGDEVARYGGEEFGVILPNTSREGVLHIAELMRAAVADLKIVYEGQRIPLTVSIGVCFVHKQAHTAQQLVAAADAALYQAKGNGRNQVREAPPL